MIHLLQVLKDNTVTLKGAHSYILGIYHVNDIACMQILTLILNLSYGFVDYNIIGT